MKPRWFRAEVVGTVARKSGKQARRFDITILINLNFCRGFRSRATFWHYQTECGSNPSTASSPQLRFRLSGLDSGGDAVGPIAVGRVGRSGRRL